MGNVELRIEGRDLVRTRTIICASCKHADDHAACTIDGHPIGWHVQGGKCPKGKQADANGHVRWLGVKWMGIPKPVRWWNNRTEKLRWDEVPGCGCVVWLKRLALKVKGRIWQG